MSELVDAGTPALDPPPLSGAVGAAATAVAIAPPALGARALVGRLRARLFADGARGTLARGALWSFALSAVGMVMGFALQILLVRALRPEAYGRYLYVLAGMNAALLFGRLELDQCAVRFVGAYSGTGAWGRLRGFRRRSAQIVTGASLAIALAGGTLAWLRRDSLGTALTAGYLAACVLLPLTAHLQLQGAVLQGFKAAREAQIPNNLVRPLLVALGVAVPLLAHRALDARDAILLQAAATGGALWVGARFLRRVVPAAAGGAAPDYRTREWVRTSTGMIAISLGNLVLSTQMDVLVVGTFVGATDAGVYGVANQLASLISFASTAVIFIMMPMIADLHARGQRDELQRLVTLAARVNTIVVLPALPLMALAGRRLLAVYDPHFVAGYAVLLLLSTSSVVGAAVGGLAGFMLTMTGHQTQASWIIGGCAVLNLLLAMALTPRYGVVGAAVSTLAAALVRHAVTVIVVRRRLAVNALPLGGG